MTDNKCKKIISYEDIQDKELVTFFKKVDSPILKLLDKGKNYIFLLGEKGFITIRHYGD